MKLKFLNTAVAGLILSLSCLVSTANAGLILEDTTAVDTSGQSYSQIFDVTGFENYTNLVFTVNARGDYGRESSEFIEFFIDNMSFGQFSYNSTGVTSAIGATGNIGYDWVMDFSFTISDVDWNTVFANDSAVKVQWKNEQTVGASNGFYVNYSLSGTPDDGNVVDPIGPVPVPAPTTLALFALALVGFASRKFKQHS
jgi:hypothetical protein